MVPFPAASQDAARPHERRRRRSNQAALAGLLDTISPVRVVTAMSKLWEPSVASEDREVDAVRRHRHGEVSVRDREDTERLASTGEVADLVAHSVGRRNLKCE